MEMTQKVRASVIIKKLNKILLLRYEYGNYNVFSVPGGLKEKDESAEGTITRELMEELNIYVDTRNILLVCETINTEKKINTTHLIFEGIITSGKIKLNKDHTHAKSFEWCPEDECKNLNLYPNIGKFIYPESPVIYVGNIQQFWFG